MEKAKKIRAPGNRTLVLTENEKAEYKKKLIYAENLIPDTACIQNKIICADLSAVSDKLPEAFVDLLIIDPPYNLNKDFGDFKFSRQSDEGYFEYLKSWFPPLLKTLKKTASVYICCDWKNSCCVYTLLKEFCIVRNRITWQREKGRGSKRNWKNSCEDIWFATVSGDYYFNVDAVKQRRKVLAPYRQDGQPKDWEETSDGKFRMTHPGNFWDDISVPYWSMRENTDHPTQKSEKLLAKLILASSPEGAMVFDPFAGSGSTMVAAKKLGRNFCGIEMNEEYCLWAQKRLYTAESDKTIQGYSDGVFWERNSRGAGENSGCP